MHTYKENKVKYEKKRKNNIYFKKISNTLLRLQSKMNKPKNKADIMELKEEINTSETSQLPKKQHGLWRSHQEFIGLFKNSPDALVYTDLNGIILETNKRFETLSGFSVEDARGKYFKDLLNIRILQKKINHHSFPESEMEIRGKDRKKIHISMSFTSNLIDNEKLGNILLLRDITNRKRNEEINNALYNISRAANSNISLKELYPIIRRELHTIIDTSNFYVALFDEEKNSLQFCYYIDETGEKNENFLVLKNSQSGNIFHYIFKTGRSLFLNYNKYKKMMRDGDFSSHDVITNKQIWLGVPLKVADKTIGSMVLQSYTNPKLYSEKDIKLMEFVSQQVATAIDRKRAEEKLKILSLYDSLTGLPNRILFYDRIKQEIAYAKREHKKFALMFFDLDNFKKVNDKFGHDIGDRLLQAIAESFKNLLRETDTICRLGGDEFIILLARLTLPRDNITDVLQKILNTLNKPFVIEGHQISINVSIGIALYPNNGQTGEELIKNADKAMYRAKNDSENYYHWAI